MPRGRDFDRWDDSPPVSAPQRPAAPFPGRAEAPVSRRPVPPPPPMPSGRYNDAMFEQARSAEPPEPPRHPLRRSMNDRRAPVDAGADIRDVVEAAELGVSARAAPSARDAFPAAPPAPPEYDRRDPRMFDQQVHDQDLRLPDDFQEPMLEPTFTGEEARPAPRRSTRQPPPPVVEDEKAQRRALRPKRSARDWIKSAAALLIVAGLGGALLWQWPNLMAAYQKMRAPATSEVRDVPAAGSRSTKINDRIEPGVQPSQGTADTATAPGAAVAQKVVLYEEDPADPNGKRFVGSAIWRTETISPGPGQPPELAIRADVDVPDRKLAMTWSLRRNTDQSLPASHTVEITFKLPSDFPSGGISNVPGILMKQAEQTRGVPLAGLAVKVTTGFFLIGLSSADADRDRNLQLLKERAWFDIPVVYNNNRRAILAIEKGTPGDRVFAEAFKTWKQ
jgi:hypothetical protein